MYINDKFYYFVQNRCYILELETDNGRYGFLSDVNFDN